MIRIAADVFAKEPDLERVREAMNGAYAVFRERHTGLYLVCAGVDPDGRPDMSDEYINSVRPGCCDVPLVSAHPDARRHLTPPDMGCTLSGVLGQTVVSFYSTDDEYDAATIAEDGRPTAMFWASGEMERARRSGGPRVLAHHDDMDDEPQTLLRWSEATGTIESFDPEADYGVDWREFFPVAQSAIRAAFDVEVHPYEWSDMVLSDTPAEDLATYGEFELLDEVAHRDPVVRRRAGRGKFRRWPRVLRRLLRLPLTMWRRGDSFLDKVFLSGVTLWIMLFVVSLVLHLTVLGIAALMGLESPEWARD